MRAAASGHLDTVRALLKRSVDVNEKGGLGFTALMLAAEVGNLEIAKALLDAGADPNAAYGIAHVGAWSPLTLAMNRCNEHRLAMMDLLIAGGAKIDPVNSFRINPLESAIDDDDVPMVKALLTRGADVNRKSLIPETPLVDTPLVEAVSVARPDVEIVRVLLEAGADPNLPLLWVGNEYVSLLSYLEGWLKGPAGGERVEDGAREEIVRMLKQAGAKRVRTPAQRDEDRTPTPDNGMQQTNN
jgi:ankyrin repeat protein